jgi:hypothetical protein
MAAATTIRWRGTVASRFDATARLLNTGDVVLVSRGGINRLLVFKCPCGCGSELPINLDERVGPAWRIYNLGPNLTVYPSIWRESDCRAHFIVSHGHLWVFGEDGGSFEIDVPQGLVKIAKAHLTDVARHYFDIAQEVDAEPWDVLRACRELVRLQQAIEVGGRGSGRFAIVD